MKTSPSGKPINLESRGDRPQGRSPHRTTIDARKVGLSLTISDKTLREFDRIQQEAIRAALNFKAPKSYR